jgi:hypothetical protein
MCQWCSWWGVPEAALKEAEPQPGALPPRRAFEAVAVEPEAESVAPTPRSVAP